MSYSGLLNSNKLSVKRVNWVQAIDSEDIVMNELRDFIYKMRNDSGNVSDVEYQYGLHKDEIWKRKK